MRIAGVILLASLIFVAGLSIFQFLGFTLTTSTATDVSRPVVVTEVARPDGPVIRDVVPQGGQTIPSGFLLVLPGLGLLVLTLVVGSVVYAAGGPSREVGGALSLTLAAVLLISAAYIIFVTPPITSRKFEDISSRKFFLDVGSTQSYVFKKDGAKEYEVSVWSDVGFGPTGPREPPTFRVAILDIDGKKLVETKARGIFNWNLEPEAAGRHTVEISNSGNEPLSLALRVTDVTKFTHRPLEPLAQWLSLVSLPLLGLGVWLFFTSRRQV